MIFRGAVFALVGVALGAFGAHGLKERVAPEMLTVWQTGVQYHLFHALALLFVGLYTSVLPQNESNKGSLRLLRVAGALFTVGILVFAGSLYALTLSGVRVLGAITPIGGVCFLSGWALLAYVAYHAHKNNSV